MAIPTPISLKRHPPAREVSDNPVLWRELRRPLIPRLWQRIVSIIAVIGVLILLYGLLLANHDLHRPETHIGFAIIFYLLLALLACVLAGTAIAQEKESDTWTLLLATPLSARSIVLGKLWGLLRRLMWPAALFVAHFLLFAFTGVLAWRSVAIVVWITFCTCALWLVCGLYFSLRLKTVTFAVTFSLLVPVVLYGVFGATIAILGEIFDRSGRWGETLAVYWPMHYLGIAIDHFSRRHEEFEIEMPCLGRISPEVFVGWVIFIGLAYLAASATVLFYTIARFNRIVGRASQLKPLPTWAIGVLPGHTA